MANFISGFLNKLRGKVEQTQPPTVESKLPPGVGDGMAFMPESRNPLKSTPTLTTPEGTVTPGVEKPTQAAGEIQTPLNPAPPEARG